MLILQRALLPLHCPALFSCCSATKIMRIGGGYGWKCAMACFFSSKALPSLLLNKMRKTGDLIYTSLVSIEQFLKLSLSVDSFCTYYQHATLLHGKESFATHTSPRYSHLGKKKPTMMQKSWKYTDFSGRTTTTWLIIFTCSFLRFWFLL